MMGTLRKRIESQSQTTQARNEKVSAEFKSRIAALVADASISKTEAFRSMRKMALDMIHERKEAAISMDPVVDVVKIARAQGAVAALMELVRHYENAGDQAALTEKQTTG